MKNKLNYLTLLGAALGFALLSAPAHAATIIIDGTAPDYTRNGSFETSDFWQGSGSTLAGDLGISEAVTYTTGSGASDGSWYAVVAVNGYGVYQDTGYDLGSTSEVFDLSFSYGLHNTWDTRAAEIRWQLFTTTTGDDNGVVDQVIDSDSVAVDYTTPPNQVSYSSIGTVPSGSVGDSLFIHFTASSSGQYYSVDEVNLSVIPEPSTALLGALGLLALLRRRR